MHHFCPCGLNKNTGAILRPEKVDRYVLTRSESETNKIRYTNYFNLPVGHFPYSAYRLNDNYKVLGTYVILSEIRFFPNPTHV